MPSDHYDLIVIGNGPGGTSLAHRLAPTGKRILIVERGGYQPAVRPFLDLWATGRKPDQYQPGSFGPKAADTLLERDGRTWHRLSAERQR